MTVAPPHKATKQAQQRGFKGTAHTDIHAGHTTAVAVPVLAIGMKKREIIVSKNIIFLFGINSFSPIYNIS